MRRTGYIINDLDIIQVLSENNPNLNGQVGECSERTVLSCLEPVCLCWRRGQMVKYELNFFLTSLMAGPLHELEWISVWFLSNLFKNMVQNI